MSEQLESRLVLTASGFPGNDCPPDLDLSAIGDLQIVVGQPFTIDLYANGATAVDLDINDNPTGDTIRLVLDPDVGTDTPVGAKITTSGVFSWTPTIDQVGTFRIPVIAIDQGPPALADVEYLTVIVSATGDFAPSLDLNGPSAGLGFSNTFTENGGPVAATSASLTITDADSTNLQSATIVLTNFQDGADEILAVDTTGTAIVASSYNSATGELTLSGSDTLANYEAVLKTLTYNNTSEDPTVLDRIIQITVNDGGLSSPIVVSTISVIAENDAPTVDLNGVTGGIDFATTFTEGDGPIAIVDAGIIVNDVDNTNLASATVTLTNVLDASAELLSVDTTGTSIVANYDSGTGILTVTGSDTLANYQLVLATLKYENTSQNPDEADRIVEVIVNDGTVDSATATITISVEGVNDPPDLDPIADQNAQLGVLFQITVTATDPEGDVLTFQLDREGIGANIPLSATITKTSDTTAVIEWTPSEGDGAGPFTFIVLVIDDDPTTPLADSETFTVTLQTDPPAVDLNGGAGGIDFAASFTEGAGPTTVVDATATVTDTDSTNLDSATITITNVLNADDEFLAVDVTGTAITPSYDPATGILTLSGSDTLANYQTVIRSLTYDNVSDNPDTTDRAIEVIVNDAFSDSATATITVTVLAENDPPQLTLPTPYDTGSPVEVDVDTEVTFDVTVVDPDDAPENLIFILDLDGSGIPIEIAQPTITTPPGTIPGGKFSWTPSQTGTYTITIIVLDDDGAVDQETFILTVVDPTPQSPLEGESLDSDLNDAALLGVLDETF